MIATSSGRIQDAECQTCGGSGEVQLIDRSEAPCPACVSKELRAALAQKTKECEEAKASNELDRRSLWAVVRAIDEEITGRMWLIEGRGSYEWDDDKYRQEFGWAVHALQEKLEPLRKIAHDLKNCPETEQGVNSVRKLEAQVEQLGRQVAELDQQKQTFIHDLGNMQSLNNHLQRQVAEMSKK